MERRRKRELQEQVSDDPFNLDSMTLEYELN